MTHYHLVRVGLWHLWPASPVFTWSTSPCAPPSAPGRGAGRGCRSPPAAPRTAPAPPPWTPGAPRPPRPPPHPSCLGWHRSVFTGSHWSLPLLVTTGYIQLETGTGEFWWQKQIDSTARWGQVREGKGYNHTSIPVIVITGETVDSLSTLASKSMNKQVHN